jgi:hypothetical protein
MMQKQTDQKNMDEQFPTSAVRRSIVTISASALAACVVSPKLVFGASYPTLQDSAPQVDGFFFVIPGKDRGGSDDVNGDRVFFISSSWLPYFELTDQLTKASVTEPVRIESPGYAVVNWQKHGLGPGTQVMFSNNGPAPIMAGVPYYVRSPITEDTFQISINQNGNPKLSTTDPNPADNVATVDPYTGKQRVLGKFKSKAHKENWTVLYSDNIRDSLVPNTTTQVISLEDPRDSTYLAMHLSPSL